jgi:hypothetical protein
MPVPAVIAAAAAARIAAALAAKNLAKKAAPKVAKQVIKKLAVPGKASGAKAKVISTGKAKSNAASSKKYDPLKKGTGKPKYQNVTKEARIDKPSTPKTLMGKNLSKSERAGRNRNEMDFRKSIDSEAKEIKGQRTAKPSTPKVPVKKVK